jgi:hypothetical protein
MDNFQDENFHVINKYLIESSNIVLFSVVTNYGNKFYLIDTKENEDRKSTEFENNNFINLIEISKDFKSLKNIVVEKENKLSLKYNKISGVYQIKDDNIYSQKMETLPVYKYKYFVENYKDIIKNVNEEGSQKTKYYCDKFEISIRQMYETIKEQKLSIKKLMEQLKSKKKEFAEKKKEKDSFLDLMYARQRFQNLEDNSEQIYEIYNCIRENKKLLDELTHEVKRII